MNLRRLKYFVKIVDVGSLTQASEVLHVAQPALSQQLATLEGEFDQQLLRRTQRGVEVTAAGRVLYRHAQTILRQFELAQVEVRNARRSISGPVSVGLAPGTAAAEFALPLIQAVHENYPDIVLHISENLGSDICDGIRNGRIDMAIFYGRGSGAEGLVFEPILSEDLYVVAPPGLMSSQEDVEISELHGVDLLLPRSDNQLRAHLDRAFQSAHIVPRIVAEMESSFTLSEAVGSGIGATILPGSVARLVAASAHGRLMRIISPRMEIPLALCGSAYLPLSEPAQVVKSILLDLAQTHSVSEL